MNNDSKLLIQTLPDDKSIPYLINSGSLFYDFQL